MSKTSWRRRSIMGGVEKMPKTNTRPPWVTDKAGRDRDKLIVRLFSAGYKVETLAGWLGVSVSKVEGVLMAAKLRAGNEKHRYLIDMAKAVG